MFDEPDEAPADRSINPADRARDKSDEFRMHAEFAAVFEGPRKFDAHLIPLGANIAREVQRTIGRLEKSKSADSPILPPASISDATALLSLGAAENLSTNDYHISRRPGELMILRLLAGDQVDAFYERLQAHFDAALEGFREEERSGLEWKQDEKTLAYLKALDEIEMKMADRYLRDLIRKQNLFVLSTQTADELNISYLSDYVMGVSAEELLGEIAAASSDEQEQSPSTQTWFFKLFSLRAMIDSEERMCFFAYLQRSEEGAW